MLKCLASIIFYNRKRRMIMVISTINNQRPPFLYHIFTCSKLEGKFTGRNEFYEKTLQKNIEQYPYLTSSKRTSLKFFFLTLKSKQKSSENQNVINILYFALLLTTKWYFQYKTNISFIIDTFVMNNENYFHVVKDTRRQNRIFFF